jgi:hypothetical protein
MICQGFGGNLAEIENEKENRFLANKVKLLKGKIFIKLKYILCIICHHGHSCTKVSASSVHNQAYVLFFIEENQDMINLA